MIDYVFIGPTPCEEECAQVGEENYAERGRAECKRFIELIRKTVGAEPEGAALVVKGEQSEFGTYFEVAVRYDDNIRQAIDYAYKVEEQAPMYWENA
jgi:hypothetical protein